MIKQLTKASSKGRVSGNNRNLKFTENGLKTILMIKL